MHVTHLRILTCPSTFPLLRRVIHYNPLQCSHLRETQETTLKRHVCLCLSPFSWQRKSVLHFPRTSTHHNNVRDEAMDVNSMNILTDSVTHSHVTNLGPPGLDNSSMTSTLPAGGCAGWPGLHGIQQTNIHNNFAELTAGTITMTSYPDAQRHVQIECRITYIQTCFSHQ